MFNCCFPSQEEQEMWDFQNPGREGEGGCACKIHNRKIQGLHSMKREPQVTSNTQWQTKPTIIQKVKEV